MHSSDLLGLKTESDGLSLVPMECTDRSESDIKVVHCVMVILQFLIVYLKSWLDFSSLLRIFCSMIIFCCLVFFLLWFLCFTSSVCLVNLYVGSGRMFGSSFERWISVALDGVTGNSHCRIPTWLMTEYQLRGLKISALVLMILTLYLPILNLLCIFCMPPFKEQIISSYYGMDEWVSSLGWWLIQSQEITLSLEMFWSVLHHKFPSFCIL